MDQPNKKRRFSELKIQPVEYVFCEIGYKKTTINDHCFLIILYVVLNVLKKYEHD